MAIQTAATLKGYFNTGDVPTEAQFADLIDSVALVTAPYTFGPDWTFGIGAHDSVENYRATLKTYGNVADFNLSIGGQNFNGVYDDMFFWGYNVKSPGRQIDLAQAAIFQWFEADYFNAGTHTIEWNMDVIPSATGANNRMLYFVAERANLSFASWWFTIGTNTDGTGQFRIRGTNNVAYFFVDAPGKVTIAQDLNLTRTSPGAAVQFSDTGRFTVPVNKFFNFSADGGATQHVVLGAATTFNAATTIGFFGHAAVAQQTKAGHNNWAAISDVVSALVNLGLFDAV